MRLRQSHSSSKPPPGVHQTIDGLSCDGQSLLNIGADESGQAAKRFIFDTSELAGPCKLQSETPIEPGPCDGSDLIIERREGRYGRIAIKEGPVLEMSVIVSGRDHKCETPNELVVTVSPE